jgi:hypothetical protein
MDNFKRLPNEGPKAYQAFMAYCEMGHRRSLSKLAEALGKRKSLLSRWSSKYTWVDRSSAYDNHLHEVRMKEIEDEIVENERKRAEIARVLIEKASEGLEDIDPSKLKIYERIKMIDIGAKIVQETKYSELKYYEDKSARKQNKVIFELVTTEGKRINLSPEEAEVIE